MANKIEKGLRLGLVSMVLGVGLRDCAPPDVDRETLSTPTPITTEISPPKETPTLPPTKTPDVPTAIPDTPTVIPTIEVTVVPEYVVGAGGGNVEFVESEKLVELERQQTELAKFAGWLASRPEPLIGGTRFTRVENNSDLFSFLDFTGKEKYVSKFDLDKVAGYWQGPDVLYTANYLSQENRTGVNQVVVNDKDGNPFVYLQIHDPDSDNHLSILLPYYGEDGTYWSPGNTKSVEPGLTEAIDLDPATDGGFVNFNSESGFVNVDAKGVVTHVFGGVDEDGKLVWNEEVIVPLEIGGEMIQPTWNEEYETWVWEKEGKIEMMYEQTTERVMAFSQGGRLVVLCDATYGYKVDISQADPSKVESFLRYWAEKRDEYYEGDDLAQLANHKRIIFILLPYTEFNKDPLNEQWPFGSYVTAISPNYPTGHDIRPFPRVNEKGETELVFITYSGRRLKDSTAVANKVLAALIYGGFTKAGGTVPSIDYQREVAGGLIERGAELNGKIVSTP